MAAVTRIGLPGSPVGARPRGARVRIGLLGAMLCALATPVLAQTVMSRGTDRIPTGVADCKARARQALDLEGYTIVREMIDGYFGRKDIYVALIVCSPGASDAQFNVVVAANGGLVDEERDRLGAHLIYPTRDSTGGGRPTPPAPAPGPGTGGQPTPAGTGQGGSSGVGNANLAFRRPARQSSVYEEPGRGADDAQHGNDGQKSRGPSFHTRSEPNAWWQVELHDEYPIAEVRLYNRLDCCSERSRTIQVLLSRDGNTWTTVFRNDGTIFGGVDGDKPLRVPIDGVPARYVRVQLAEKDYLHLDEVEVYGRGINYEEDTTPRGTRITGPPTDIGRNLALNRPTRQSSVYRGVPPLAPGGADGVRAGGFGFHTDSEPNPWWEVDLGGDQPVTEIRIYNRLDCCSERAGTLRILLSYDGVRWDTVFAHDGTSFGGADGKPLRVSVKGFTAQFVRVQLAETNYLHLDEVEVY